MPNSIPVKAPNFGAWLQLQRGDRSLEQVARAVRRLIEPTGLKVDQSQLSRIEAGRVPSWPILLALARVYKIDPAAMATELIVAVEFPGSKDLLCPADGVQHASDATPERETTHAHARAREAAEELVSIAEAFSDALSHVAHRLTGDIPAAPPHDADRADRRETADRLRRARKTG
jgi:transcriptional regulator with XRE-family HTH domain